MECRLHKVVEWTPFFLDLWVKNLSVFLIINLKNLFQSFKTTFVLQKQRMHRLHNLREIINSTPRCLLGSEYYEGWGRENTRNYGQITLKECCQSWMHSSLGKIILPSKHVARTEMHSSFPYIASPFYPNQCPCCFHYNSYQCTPQTEN